MPGTPENLVVGTGDAQRRIAVLRRAGGTPGIFWLGGYRSDMLGTKAQAIDRFAAAMGLGCTRFDYSGHGQSGGEFTDGTISRWLDEAAEVFATTKGPQIVVGSSMGGWLALLLADRARMTEARGRVAGMVLIAPAVDMTKVLMWDTFPKAVKQQLSATGTYLEPSRYSAEPVPITRKLISDGELHLYGDRLIEPGCPVHSLQGMKDEEVPYWQATGLLERLASDDVVLTLVKDGDHRLSRLEDLDRLQAALSGIVQEIAP